MKKTILLLLTAIFSLTVLGQVNQSILQKYEEFVKSESGSYPFKQKYKHTLKMPLEPVTNSNKRSTNIHVLDSIVSHTVKSHLFFGDADKVIDVFTYDKAGRQTSATEKIYFKDSLITENILNLKYSKGNMIEKSYHEVNKLNYRDYKNEYFYENEKLSEVRYYYEDEYRELSLNTISHNIYNSINLIDSTAYFLVDTNGIERKYYNNKYTYKENEILRTYYLLYNNINEISYYSSKFNNKNQLYEASGPSSKTLYFYNDLEKIERYEKYKKENNIWVLDEKIVYNYTDDGEILKYVSTDTYINRVIKIEISFEDEDLIKRYHSIKIDGANEYTNETKSTYLQDENGNIIEVVNYSWNKNNKDWIEDRKNVYYCDKNYIYNSNLLFTYTELLAHIVTNNNNNNEPNIWNIITSQIEYEYNDMEETWEEIESRTYYYSDKKINFTQSSKPYIEAFPNPANNYFTIDLANLPSNTKILMYNLNGIKVMDKVINQPAGIDIRHLPKGIYYFKLMVDNEFIESTGKLIKQ